MSQNDKKKEDSEDVIRIVDDGKWAIKMYTGLVPPELPQLDEPFERGNPHDEYCGCFDDYKDM